MIPVFAIGPQAELFRGIYENTAIHEKMKIALDLE
jgi:alkaline phosphatase